MKFSVILAKLTGATRDDIAKAKVFEVENADRAAAVEKAYADATASLTQARISREDTDRMAEEIQAQLDEVRELLEQAAREGGFVLPDRK